MDVVKTYSKEQMSNAEKLAQTIAVIPDNKKIITIAIMNAYIDGFIAGNELKSEMNEQ